MARTPPQLEAFPEATPVVDEQADFRHPEWEQILDPAGSNGWRPLTGLERAMREIDATDAGSDDGEMIRGAERFQSDGTVEPLTVLTGGEE